MKKILCYLMFCVAFAFIAAGCKNDDDKPMPPDDPTKVNLDAKYQLGTYEYNEWNEGLSHYYMFLSNVKIEGTTDDPIISGAGKQVFLDMYAVATEEGILPVGTYKFISEEADIEPFSFSTISNFSTSNEQGEILDENMIEFKSSTLIISEKDGVYTVIMAAEMMDGRSLKCNYTGPFLFVKGGGGGDIFPPIEANINTTFIDSKTIYLGKTDSGAGHFSIQMFDYENDGYNHPGHIMTFEIFSELKNDTKILSAGTYTIATTFDDFDTYSVGDLQPGLANETTYVNEGTNCVKLVANGDLYDQYFGFAKSGTAVVTLSGDEYTIKVDLVDVNGFKMQGQYKGKLTVIDKSYYSTLTEDYDVDFLDAPCEIEYMGQAYAEDGLLADSWCIYIGTWENGTEALQMELLVPHGTFADRVPAKEYAVTVTYDSETAPYVCIPGEMHNGGEMYCSWYMGGFMDGLVYEMAPFVSGTVVVNESEGVYSFMVDVIDDAPVPHKFTAVWEGTPTFIDKTKTEFAPSRVARKKAVVMPFGARKISRK